MYDDEQIGDLEAARCRENSPSPFTLTTTRNRPK
jgi:hypothetical protein